MKYYSTGMYSIFIINDRKVSISKDDVRHDVLLSLIDDDDKAQSLLSKNEFLIENGFKCVFNENKI